jgi:hypothetical protein
MTVGRSLPDLLRDAADDLGALTPAEISALLRRAAIKIEGYPDMPADKEPREIAARALCRFHGNPENTQFEGKPMWMSYLDEADAVLKAIGGKPEGSG